VLLNKAGDRITLTFTAPLEMHHPVRACYHSYSVLFKSVNKRTLNIAVHQKVQSES